jgi:hypothetical protein
MPVTSFVLTPSFDWTLSPARAPGKPPGTRCRPEPKRKKAKAKKAKIKPAAKLSPQCRSVLIDRLEAATLDGRIELCDEDMPCEALDFTLAELAFLLERVLFPEEYRDPTAARVPPPPTATPPGSAARIAEYAARVTRGQPTFAVTDARADRAHDPGLRIEQRRNGSGVKVVGWAEDEE